MLILKSRCWNHCFKDKSKAFFIRQISTSAFVNTVPRPHEDVFRANIEIEKMLKKQDNIPDRFRLIQRHKPIFSYTAIISVTNACMIGSIISMLYAFYTGIDLQFELFGVSFDNALPFMIGICILLIFTISFIKYFVCRMVLRIYHDKNTATYIIISPSNIPFKNNSTQFVHNKNSLVDNTLMRKLFYTILNGMAKIRINKNKTFFVFEDDFRTSADYHNLIDGDKHIYP